MKKTFLIAGLLLSLVFLASTAYAGGAQEKKGAATEKGLIKITDWQGGVDNILNSYKEFISIFESKHPGVKLEYTQYTYTSYNKFLKPALASGQAPDIFAIYPGSDVPDIAKTGNIIALSDVIDKDWKKWLGKAFNFTGGRWDGKLWIAPQDAQTELIWVYADLMEKAGRKVPPLGQGFTVDEWISLVGPARANGNDVILAGHADSYSITGAFYNMVHQLQTSDSPDMVLDALDGKISWQQDIFKKVFQAYKKLHDAGVWRKDAISMDYQVQAWGAWLEKKGIGIWCNGDWFAGSVPEKENNPSNPNIRIIAYPFVDKSATPAFNWGFGTDLAVYAKGKNKKLALEFVRFTNSPEASKIFVKNFVNPAAAGSVDVQKIGTTGNPIFDECIKMYTYQGARASTYFYTQAEPQRALFDGVVNVLLGKEDIDSALANLDKVSGYGQ